jgi:DHA1 family inner membrane transport protein
MLDQPMKVALDSNLHRLAFQVGVATSSRLLLNTARRFAYPFAPALSRGLGIPLTKVTSLITVNQATGILGILFGPLADCFGYRLMMLVGIGMMAIGMFSGGLLPFYSVVLVALFLAGLGKTVFDPALQAYVGKQVPFQRRGTAIGLLEFSWAGSTLIGMPLWPWVKIGSSF